MVPEGPASQPQLISSQVPSKTDGLSSGLKNPLVLAKGSKAVSYTHLTLPTTPYV